MSWKSISEFWIVPGVLAALCSIGDRSAWGQAGDIPLTVERRVILFDKSGYAFDEFQSSLQNKPHLLRIGANDVMDFDIFGAGRPLVFASRFRWNLDEDALFVTADDTGQSENGISRYPLGAIARPIPPSAWPIDEEKVSSEWKKFPGKGLTDLGFGDLWPQYFLKSGLAWDEEGKPNRLLRESIPREEIHFDIIALSVSKLRLYFTAKGDLSIWDTDGEKWELVKDHVTTIDGPFLVLDQGRSALVQRDGKWGLLTPLGGDSPQFTPIVKRDGDEPIRVVEDRDAGVNYFIYKGDILDAQGRVLDRVPPGLNSEERLIHLTRFALARREPK